MLKIYISDTEKLNDKYLFNIKLQEISRERRERIEKFRFSKDKKLSLLSGLLVNKISSEFNIPPDLSYNEKGKPSFRHSGNFFLSISHSQCKAMVCVSDKQLGCDIQFQKDDVNPKIAQRCFQRSECDYIFSNTDTAKQRFFRIWTLKESFVKYTGDGLGKDFENSEFVFLNAPKVKKDGIVQDCSFFEIALDDYSSAVCYDGNKKENPEIYEEALWK